MQITFDPAKDAANLRKHGLSLALAAEFELETAVVIVDDRRNYGEVRYRAFGRLFGLGHCLVFTRQPGVMRVISLRRAREKELRRYGVE